MRKIRRITEAEVISEFLKAEFYHREFDADRFKYENYVFDPDLTDKNENEIRRALLYRRRATMWREIPRDTQWWEIELDDDDDLEQVNVFPRAQWRRLSAGNFQALHVADRIRRQLEDGKSNDLLSKIGILRTRLQYEGPKSTVMLIGINEEQPVTLLEGNHRFVSALLVPRKIMLRRLRLVCGFSPNMHKCCWYKTDLANLVHYTKNRIKHLWSRDADVSRLLPEDARSANGDYANAISSTNSE